ncbi:MAG: family acetyltransferase [Anaerocolumna sp.]|jgi:RimJ/RimL family protein N-acetyltransferase|nr:family acetyltransferase [Anaerocolumna sp.]
MFIQNKNLIIRDAVLKDAEILCHWWNDGRVMAHAGFPNGVGISIENLQKQLAASENSKVNRLIIEADNKAIGEMSYSSTEDGGAEIGIKICDDTQQEKGYGRILLSMLIKELFRTGYTKILLDTNLNNTRAQHVYEKLGFIKRRVNKDVWKDQSGRLQTSIDYELTQTDFIDFT